MKYVLTILLMTTLASRRARSSCRPSEEVPSRLKFYDKSRVGVRAGKESNILVSMARCCNPQPGDAIVGYVSRGRGVIVHRRGCRSLQYIRDFETRSIEVEWETVSPLASRRFRVTAREEPEIFSEIEGAIRKYHGHLISGKLSKNDRGTLTGYFTVEIEDKNQFKRVLKSIRTIPAIVNLQALGPA